MVRYAFVIWPFAILTLILTTLPLFLRPRKKE